jgi:hypothetical protein
MASFISEYKNIFKDHMWSSFFSAWGLRQFANGLMVVYSPLFFYTNGKGLSFVLAILAVQSFFNAVMRLPVAIAITGIKNIKIIFASATIALGLVYFGYYLFIDNNLAIIVLAGLEGALLAIVNSCFVYIFSATQKRRSVGSQVGLQNDLSYSMAILAIFIGGLIASAFGLGANFILASIFLILASIRLLNMKIVWPHKNKRIKYKQTSFSANWPKYISGGASIIDLTAVTVLWPLTLVVVNYFSYKNIGLLISAGLALSLAVNLLIGRYDDDIDRAKNALKKSILGTLLVYILRIISIYSLIGAILLTIIGIVVRGIFEINYSVIFYNKLKKTKNKILFIAEHESISSYMLTIYFLLLIIVNIIFDSVILTLIASLLIASMAVSIAGLIDTERE